MEDPLCVTRLKHKFLLVTPLERLASFNLYQSTKETLITRFFASVSVSKISFLTSTVVRSSSIVTLSMLTAVVDMITLINIYNKKNQSVLSYSDHKLYKFVYFCLNYVVSFVTLILSREHELMFLVVIYGRISAKKPINCHCWRGVFHFVIHFYLCLSSSTRFCVL